jgi:hypothetical protein
MRGSLKNQVVSRRWLVRSRASIRQDADYAEPATGFSPIDPAIMTIQPLAGSDLFFSTETAEASPDRLSRFHGDQSAKILLLSV